jgi:hypothetical protein
MNMDHFSPFLAMLHDAPRVGAEDGYVTTSHLGPPSLPRQYESFFPSAPCRPGAESPGCTSEENVVIPGPGFPFITTNQLLPFLAVNA